MIIDIFSILPLTCALFVLFFGLFVLSKSFDSRMNQLMFGFCMTMWFWMFGTFMMFAMRGADKEMSIFWDRFVYFGVVFMPPLMHHFSLLFTGRQHRQKAALIMNYALAFFFLFASTTPYFVDDLYYYSWGVHTQARVLHHVFLGYFFIGTGLFFINLWSYFRKLRDQAKRLQTIYVFLAFAVVIFIGGSAYLFAYGVDTRFPFSYLSGIVFPVMLFYAVTRHHVMGMKVVLTEVLVGITNFLVVLQIFLSRTPLEIFIRVVFAVLIVIISMWLIRSVNQEVRRREEITTLAHSLERANLRLQELDKQKTEFLSIATHQLRTPLSATKGFIELIEDGAYGKASDKMLGVLRDIDTNNDRLVKLVDEFLDASRIEQGRTKFSFVPAGMNAVIESVLKELAGRVEEKHCSVKWEKNNHLPLAEMDEEKIRHVVMNYIDNAAKYSQSCPIGVSAAAEQGGIAVRVKDGGIGFGKVDEANFFQKFYRGENVKRENVNGTGLGLFICRKFIEAHGGHVWAKSPGLGKGSEFGFWIPLKNEGSKE